MARCNRTPSDRAAALRWAVGLFRLLASLQLAVLLIGALAVLLAWATFVESRYGAATVRFGIYGTWWFTALGVLLGLNIFCAAAIRFPWKRHQTGFVVTHLGLLVLLAGFLLGRVGGIHATLPIFEGRANWKAFEDSQHFALSILPPDDSSPPDAAETEQAPIVVPFRAGPFNWQDYGKLFPFPWRLARRDRGVVYDRDGIKLEVLDYYADSKKLSAPRLELKVNPQQGSSPAAGLSAEPWLPVSLVIGGHGGPQAAMHRFGMNNRHTLSSGWRFVFWMTDSAAQIEAFADSAPRGPLGSHGRIVLHAGGERFEFAVDQLQKQPRRALGQTGRELEFLGFDPRFLAVRLMIHQKNTPSRQMVLLADMPDFNRQDPDHGVFGAFWYDAAQAAAGDETPDQRTLRRAALPRVDILQGPGGRLYYRTWRSPQAGTIGPLPADGREVAARAAENAVAFYVEKYLPLDAPGTILLPVAFSKGGSQGKQRQARVRLTVDGNSQEFFLEGTGADPLSSRPTADQRKVVEGKGRRVAITMPADEIDIGFQVYLRRFNRKLDPGTSQASHYSSLVDFCDRRDRDKRLHEQITITPNGPVDFSDPQSGRSYRLFQESFRGPWRRGHPLFDEVAGADSDRRQLFLSWLRVNYDPGRGLKYAGSFLIVLGIVIMYYMKAYFFKRTKTRCQV